MSQITEEMVQDAIRHGISEKDARRGYAVTLSRNGNGATYIICIRFMEAFQSDWAAAEQAERDGIKIIHDLRLPKEHKAATPINRLLLKELELTK